MVLEEARAPPPTSIKVGEGGELACRAGLNWRRALSGRGSVPLRSCQGAPAGVGGGHVNHAMQLNIPRPENGAFSTEGHTYIT